VKYSRFIFAFGILFSLVVVIYGNSLDGSWHFDDYGNIVGNPNIQLKSMSWPEIERSFQGMPGHNIKRPLAYFSFALNYFLHGYDVAGYHVVNIFIHFVTAVFLFLFIYRTLSLPVLSSTSVEHSYSVALLTTVLWAVNPVQVGAVTYVVQRMAGMAAMFYIMAMYFYLIARTTMGASWRRPLFFVFCFLSALCSILTKANAAMLPVSLLIFDLLLIQGVTRESIIRTTKLIAIPLFLVTLIGYYYTNISIILDGYNHRPFSLTERLLTEPRVLLFYISLILYPLTSRLTLLHDFELSRGFFDPWTTLPAILIIFFSMVYAILTARKRPLVSFCILFFFLNHLIEGSFIPLEIVYEHRNYLPSMFFFLPISLMVVRAMEHFARRRTLLAFFAAFVILVIIIQGVTVYLQNGIYKDELSLWSDNAVKAPNLQRPHHNLALDHLAAGRLDEAERELHWALVSRDDASRINKSITCRYLGLLYRMRAKDDLAERHFRKAVENNPYYPEPYQGLAEIMAARARYEEAQKYINRALSLAPGRVDFHLTLGIILLEKGQPDDAIREAVTALKGQGNLSLAYALLAKAYEMKHNKSVSRHFKRIAQHAN